MIVEKQKLLAQCIVLLHILMEVSLKSYAEARLLIQTVLAVAKCTGLLSNVRAQLRLQPCACPIESPDV